MSNVSRLGILSAVLLASTLRASSQEPQSAQPPVFRGGTTLVQVDAIVSDPSGRPIDDLTAADFTVMDEGRPVAIDRVRFLGAAGYGGGPTPGPGPPAAHGGGGRRAGGARSIACFFAARRVGAAPRRWRRSARTTTRSVKRRATTSASTR